MVGNLSTVAYITSLICIKDMSGRADFNNANEPATIGEEHDVPANVL